MDISPRSYSSDEGGGEVIEFVTWPRNIAEWNHDEDLFYFEVFGEARPRFNPGYVQVPLSEENEAVRRCTNLAPLYEYYWSLGYIDLDGKRGPGSWGGELVDTAAEVTLYFPTSGGWRVEELLATIKYLCPAKEHTSLLQEAAHMFATAQPIVEDASKLATIGSGLPGVGPIAAGTATLLDVIAKLKVTSVPPASGYEWSVQKVTQHTQGEGLLQGVKWIIPKRMFAELGSRLTGSIAVSVIPSIMQYSPQEAGDIQPRRLPIRGTAAMSLHPGWRLESKPILLPPKDSFLELQIQPIASGLADLEQDGQPPCG
jgi:hypothetical protein